MTNQFRYTSYAQEIIFGPGSITHLPEAIKRFHWQRLMLCASGSLRRDGTVSAIEGVLGSRLVATYEQVQPHVPDFQVAEALASAGKHEVDALIGLGGGSCIGMAKALSRGMGEQRTGQGDNEGEDAINRVPTPVIAIPTTYAGSEMTPVYGVTHHGDGLARKITVADNNILPRLVIYDPLLTRKLPAAMTAATGINALAHCIEALYSITRNPLSTAAELGGIRAISSALPRCYVDGDDLEARSEMLSGAFLAGSALAHVAMALHHGLCHILGGTAGVPHGVANSIVLPHAMRFNLDATAPQLAQGAEAMGISLAGRSAESAVEEAIQRVYDLIGQMNLPQRLRDIGVQETDLPHLARVALQSRAVQSNPKPISDVAQIEEVLRAAW